MRAGYRLEQEEFNSVYWALYAPSGELVAPVTYRNYYDKAKPYAVVKSPMEGIEHRTAADRDELQKIVATVADEHYMLTTTAWQRFHDRFNQLVDFPIVKLVGIVAAIVAAAASVLALVLSM